MKKVILNILILLFLTYNIKAKDLDFRKHDGISSAVRSLFIPGWGQFYNEEYNKAYIMFTTNFILLFTTLYLYNKSQETYDRYEKKGLINDPLYDEYETQLGYTNFFLFLTILSWSYNIFDAYISGEKYKKLYGIRFNNKGMFITYRF